MKLSHSNLVYLRSRSLVWYFPVSEGSSYILVSCCVEEFVEEQGEHVEEFGELVENEDMEEGAQSEDFNDYEDYASDYEEDSQGHQDDYERTEKINQY